MRVLTFAALCILPRWAWIVYHPSTLAYCTVPRRERSPTRIRSRLLFASSESIRVLQNPEGKQVYLVGTAHISANSANTAREVVQLACPDVVMVELDPKRIGLLDEALAGEITKAGGFVTREVQAKFRQAGFDLPERTVRHLEQENKRELYGGIGVFIGEHNSSDPDTSNTIGEDSTRRIVLIDAVKHMAAYNAGLRAGDVLLACDGVSLSNKSLDEIQAILQGEPNTVVTVRYTRSPREGRSTTEHTATITREAVKASSAFKSIKNTLAEREEAEHQRNNPAQILLRLARRVLELVARLLSWLSDTWRRVWWALANAMVSDRMTKLERTLGWTYGGEVQAAAQEARRVGARILLGDRDRYETARRVLQAVKATPNYTEQSIEFQKELEREGERRGVDLTFDLFSGDYKDKESLTTAIESIKGGEVVEVYTATLREHLPLVHAALLAERDSYLASSICSAASSKLVAVVGMAHLRGIQQLCEENAAFTQVYSGPVSELPKHFSLELGSSSLPP